MKASKQYLIYSPPCVLTIQLKRFEQYLYFGYQSVRKIRGHVDFPFELDIAPFCSKNGQRVSSDQKKVLYSLYGIISHSGDLGGGHYIAYVKSRHRLDCLKQFIKAGMKYDRLCQTMEELQTSPQTKQLLNLSACKEEIHRQLDEDATWYFASDTYVQSVTEKDVKNAEAYILFYERII